MSRPGQLAHFADLGVDNRYGPSFYLLHHQSQVLADRAEAEEDQAREERERDYERRRTGPEADLVSEEDESGKDAVQA